MKNENKKKQPKEASAKELLLLIKYMVQELELTKKQLELEKIHTKFLLKCVKKFADESNWKGLKFTKLNEEDDKPYSYPQKVIKTYESAKNLAEYMEENERKNFGNADVEVKVV